MRLLIIVFFLFLSELSYGAGGGAVHDIPCVTIRAQVINVGLTLGILIYFLKDKVRVLFAGRVEKFDEEYKKAIAVKEEATAKRNEIKERLQNLKVNAEKSIEDSELQAKENTAKFLSEAKMASDKIVSEAENKVQNQLDKIVSELKTNLLKKSFDKARVDISDKISPPEVQRLKDEFMKNIQVVKQ